MTAGTFKKRYANHKKSLNVPRYSAETELSKYAWKLKKSGKQYNIKWSILKRARAYTAGAARCNLCLEEKVCLLEADKKRLLNKRSELFAKCKTTTYQRSFLNRTKRLWNVLPKSLTGNNISLGQFKNRLSKYYKLALEDVFDVDDPRTWKSICLSCNKSRNLSCQISCCY